MKFILKEKFKINVNILNNQTQRIVKKK